MLDVFMHSVGKGLRTAWVFVLHVRCLRRRARSTEDVRRDGGGSRAGIELVLNSKVQAVRKNVVCVSNADGSTREIPFGACVWATGVAMHPLVKQLKVIAAT